VPFEGTKNSTLWVDVKAGKQKFRVYNVHLQSNRVTKDTEKVLEDGDLNDQETWSDIKNVVKKVGGATQIRAEQAEQLRAHIDACKSPVVVCGDFNDTPNSYVYKTIANGLTDSFREKGFGFGTTFAGALPFLRIDYILASPNFSIYSCIVAKGNYSDHYPVITVIGNN
jgi:endonuclease/exonuclease/phosphatase family metal-dependent hydrolase